MKIGIIGTSNISTTLIHKLAQAEKLTLRISKSRRQSSFFRKFPSDKFAFNSVDAPVYIVFFDFRVERHGFYTEQTRCLCRPRFNEGAANQIGFIAPNLALQTKFVFVKITHFRKRFFFY